MTRGLGTAARPHGRGEPAASPPPRDEHALAFDASRNDVVLFGGYQRSSGIFDLADTWTWNGTDWTDRTPAVRGVRSRRLRP